jgi:hypothetical protein
VPDEPDDDAPEDVPGVDVSSHPERSGESATDVRTAQKGRAEKKRRAFKPRA